MVVGEVFDWRDGHFERRRCRRSDTTGAASPARRMLLVRTLIAGDVLMSGYVAGMRGCHCHYHSGFIAIVTHLHLTYGSGVAHRAWQFDRGGDALNGQRHDQCPKHDEAD
ncbi:hypothetical protein GCM10025794_00900 [Massilia kyonggiensis]